MPKVSRDTLTAVQRALEQYKDMVEATALSPAAKRTYLLHAEHFVRWLDDDFEPGATLKNR